MWVCRWHRKSRINWRNHAISLRHKTMSAKLAKDIWKHYSFLLLKNPRNLKTTSLDWNKFRYLKWSGATTFQIHTKYCQEFPRIIGSFIGDISSFVLEMDYFKTQALNFSKCIFTPLPWLVVGWHVTTRHTHTRFCASECNF